MNETCTKIIHIERRRLYVRSTSINLFIRIKKSFIKKKKKVMQSFANIESLIRSSNPTVEESTAPATIMKPMLMHNGPNRGSNLDEHEFKPAKVSTSTTTGNSLSACVFKPKLDTRKKPWMTLHYLCLYAFYKSPILHLYHQYLLIIILIFSFSNNVKTRKMKNFIRSGNPMNILHFFSLILIHELACRSCSIFLLDDSHEGWFSLVSFNL